ncbi:MAG TPA: glycosyltransferase, partial [Pirellulaceae bacterium]|nr:glycosyltransferase [Pirellulaceae bacterium]
APCLEAYVHGVPVIASRHGAMAELVQHGETGLLFDVGDAQELRAAVERMFHDTDKLYQMRLAARRTFERLYTAEANYDLLIGVYNDVVTGGHLSTPDRPYLIKKSPVEA